MRPRKIGNIRNASVATASRIGHPELSAWRSIDVTDGSWTLGVVGGNLIANSTSTSTSGTSLTIDYTKDGGSGEDGTWTAGDNNADRYWRKLIGPKGQVKWSDQFTIEFLVEAISSTQELADGLFVGIAESPVTSSAGQANSGTSFEHVGAKLYWRQNNGNPAGKIAYIQQGNNANSVTSSTNENGQKVYCQWGPAVDNTDADGNPQVRRGVLYLLNNNDLILKSTTSAEFTTEFTGTGDVYLFVGSGFYGNTSAPTANPTGVYKIWYRLGLLEGGMSPDFIPGGGASLHGGFDLP